MSVTEAHISQEVPRDTGTTSWAPEINDLQKYRDSLKIMADRVSQAEHMWAKSLEPPQDSSQSPTHQPRRSRRMSRSKRPVPLQRPVAAAKKLRNDTGMHSPDPFQMLSPSAMSDDAVSPAVAFSPGVNPLRSPPYHSIHNIPERRVNDDGHTGRTSSPSAGQLLQKAENLLKDSVLVAGKAVSEMRRTSSKTEHAESGMAVKAHSASTQLHTAAGRAQILIEQAQCQSGLHELPQNPLEDDARVAVSANPAKALVDLSVKARSWFLEIKTAREALAERSPSADRTAQVSASRLSSDVESDSDSYP